MNDQNIAIVEQGSRQVAMADYAMTTQEVLRQAALVQQVMQAVMRDNEHYGVIPGTNGKKSLLKPGAEKLCFVFGLSPRLEIVKTDLPGGHREYQITCNLHDRSGNLRGQGVGSASTMESKHRYRGAAGKMCPKCEAQAIKKSKVEYGGGYYCDGKSGGCGAKFKTSSPEAKAFDTMPTIRSENPDPADQYNTVLKMAKKRALVDAVLTATAASDIFAQDLEDLEDKIDHTEDSQPVADAKPAKVSTVATSATAPGSTTGKSEQVAQTSAPVHPAINAARDLYRKLTPSRGGPVLDRLCKLYAAKAPKDVKAEDLDQFGKNVEHLASNLGDVEKILSDWENEPPDAGSTIDGGEKQP